MIGVIVARNKKYCYCWRKLLHNNDLIRATITNVVQCEEYLWNASVCQRIHFRNLAKTGREVTLTHELFRAECEGRGVL